MRKIWDKLVEWIQSIPSDKKMHFVAGTIIAAFFALALGMKVAVISAITAGLIKEFFDKVARPRGDDPGRSAYSGVHPPGRLVGDLPDSVSRGRSLPEGRAFPAEGWGLRAPALLAYRNPRTSRPGGTNHITYVVHYFRPAI